MSDFDPYAFINEIEGNNNSEAIDNNIEVKSEFDPYAFINEIEGNNNSEAIDNNIEVKSEFDPYAFINEIEAGVSAKDLNKPEEKDGILSSFGKSIANTGNRALEAVGGVAEMAGREFEIDGLKDTGYYLGEGAHEEVLKHAPNPDGDVAQFAADAGQVIGDLGLAIATFNPIAAGAVMATNVGGHTYRDYQDKLLAKGLDRDQAHDVATRAAIFKGIAEGATELVPAIAILKRGSALIKRLTEAGLTEAAQEALMSTVEQTYDAHQLKEMTLGEAVKNIDWSQVAYSGLVGGTVGVTVAGATHPFVKKEEEPAPPDEFENELENKGNELEQELDAPQQHEPAPIETPQTKRVDASVKSVEENANVVNDALDQRAQVTQSTENDTSTQRLDLTEEQLTLNPDAELQQGQNDLQQGQFDVQGSTNVAVAGRPKSYDPETGEVFNTALNDAQSYGMDEQSANEYASKAGQNAVMEQAQDIANNRETDGIGLEVEEYGDVTEPFDARVLELAVTLDALEPLLDEEVLQRAAHQNITNKDIILELEGLINERSQFSSELRENTQSNSIPKKPKVKAEVSQQPAVAIEAAKPVNLPPLDAADEIAPKTKQGDLNYNLPKNTIVGGVNEIAQLVPIAKANKTEKSAVRFNIVDEQQALKLKEKTGFELSGYKHTVDSSGINHALSSHGDTKAEELRGQIAVTDDDFSLIPDIVENYDDVKYVGKDKKGQDIIRYQKAYNGTTYFTEEIRNKRKELVLKSLWKTHTREQMPDQKEHPSSNVQNRLDSNSPQVNKSIDPKPNTFKPPHELSDGTPVIAVADKQNVWQNQQGEEIEDDSATALISKPSAEVEIKKSIPYVEPEQKSNTKYAVSADYAMERGLISSNDQIDEYNELAQHFKIDHKSKDFSGNIAALRKKKANEVESVNNEGQAKTEVKKDETTESDTATKPASKKQSNKPVSVSISKRLEASKRSEPTGLRTSENAGQGTLDLSDIIIKLDTGDNVLSDTAANWLNVIDARLEQINELRGCMSAPL